MSKDVLSDQAASLTSAEEEEDEEEDEKEEDEEESKVCQVCGDRASGYHFNALTCEGCKGFFRRAMKRSTRFHCPLRNACLVTKSNRRQCQSCRLRKCQSIGMLKELIMSDDAVEKRRSQIRRKKMGEVPLLLSPQQEDIIQEMVNAHLKTFDATCSQFNEFRPLDRNRNPMFVYNQSVSKPLTRRQTSSNQRRNNLPPSSRSISSTTTTTTSSSSSSLSPSSASSSRCVVEGEEERSEGGRSEGGVFTTLPHVIDVTTHMIQNIINFAKALPCFRSLAIEDQISLLKGATFEMVQIRFNMMFNVQTGLWECGPLCYCMDDAVRAGFQRHLLDPLMRFHYTLRSLGLQEVEYVLMQAIALFSPDRPGVTHHDVIDTLQEKLALTLKIHIDSKRAEPEKQLLYPKILACLTEMRTMNEEFTKQVLQIQEVQPEVSPLILEVVSKAP